MKIAKLITLAVCLAASLAANPVNCVNDTLTNYVTSGVTCTIGDKTVSGFAALYTAVAALGTALPATTDDITVAPSGDSTNPELSFQAAFNASTVSLVSLSSVTLTVAYTITAPIDDPIIETSLFLTNASVSGLGVITATEALCENGSFTSPLNPLLCTGIGVNTALTSQITNANLDATITLATGPVTELGVIKQITLTSGLGGSATASALNNGYTAEAVPEPSGIVLLPAGLVLLGVARRWVGGKRKSEPANN